MESQIEQHRDRGQSRGRDPRKRFRAGVAGTILLAVCASMLVPASAVAQAGCAPKPGSPDSGAVLQYCPKEAPRKSQESTGSGGATGADGGATGADGGSSSAAASGAGDGERRGADTGSVEFPLLDYPSTGGINGLLFVLLVALALGGLGLAARKRRGRRLGAERPR